VAGVLYLVGAGSSGQILMELGLGPLRTKQLIDRVEGFSPRTTYRCVGKMEEYGLIGRHEEPGNSKVLLRLTEPLGRNLYRLLQALGATTWEEFSLVAQLWEAGFVESMSRGPKSLMELLDGPHLLSYHQVTRRAGMSVKAGLLEVSSPKGNVRLYELTDQGRRYMALVAGIGRWRHRHLVSDDPGLEMAEVATVLRATLPLALLPDHSDLGIDLLVAGAMEYGSRSTTKVAGMVALDGKVNIDSDPREESDGSAAATTNTWFAALLDDHRGRIRVRGDCDFVDACLRQLYESLWETSPNPASP
jgi:DNA-binding HxlR family transcriptional regulator